MKFRLFFSLMISLFFIGCSEKKENKKIIYIEYISDNDSLINILHKNTAGKVSYLDDKKIMQFVPLQYLTDGYSNVHYYSLDEEVRKDKPSLNAVKYQVTFNSGRTNDSIAFTIKKYFYSKTGWQFRSDMGKFKVFENLSGYDRNLKYTNANVATNVISIIATDSYGN